MKNYRFLWLRNRTTDNRKCEKARNIKEKRTIEMFSTVSKQLVALRSSASDNRLLRLYQNGSKSPENQGLIVTSNYLATNRDRRRCDRKVTPFFCVRRLILQYWVR